MAVDSRLKPEAVQAQVLEIGGKLKTPPSDLLVGTAFTDELNNQAALVSAIGLVDLAHTLTAMAHKIIPEPAALQLLTHLLALQARPESFVLHPDNGDIYTNREAWLAQRTDAVVWLGAGRARREAVTTGFILVLREQITELSEVLISLGLVIAQQAERHIRAVMPDYTYLQAAQPTSFGHYLLGFAYPVLRDLARIENLWTRLNLSPMGCGSTNGSRLRQGREGMAELLGFDGLISHARDAMWQADLFIEISALLSASSISLSRLAEDLQVFSSQEFALVELDDCHARASKIMPQKKNPFALTHIRSVANKLIGLTASVAASVRTPTGQPDNRTLIYGELPEAIESVGHSAALLAEVLKSMTFNQARGEALVASGWVMATDLAEMLVIEYGVDFRSAHQLLAKLASDYPRKSLLDLDRQALIALAEKQLGGKIRLTEQQWASSLDVNAALQARSESGGAAAVSMMKMLADCRQQLGAFSDKVQARKNLFSSREQALLQQVSQLIRPAEAANHD